ncbi:MAG: hypothetical protein N3C60_07775 [Calditerrivibrio sp.]|nr:hypothetical protein [Calditerrivibrio sp.]
MGLDVKEIKDDLERFENLIKMINFDYERFFAKVLKHPPVVYEREVNKIIAKYNLNQITNTTLRFKFNNLVARYLTFRDKWNKKMLEYEGLKKTPIEFKKIIEEIEKPELQKTYDFSDQLTKLPDHINKAKIQEIILDKIKQYQSNGYNHFDVKIEIEEGKPKLRIKPIK